MSVNHRVDPARLDRRGVALPLALLGLVVVSLLVTAALLTSSTEMALSNAHSDGTRGLYHSDAALEAFVGERARLAPELGPKTLVPGTTYLYPLAPGDTFSIAVSRLAVDSLDDGAGLLGVNETFALVSSPRKRGGRSVGAIIQTGKSWRTIKNKIDEGVATGGGITNTGNSEISAFSSLCANDSSSGVAIRFTNDVTTEEKAQLDTSKIDGDTATLADVSSQQMIKHALGGATKEDIFAMATIKFGYDGQPDFPSSAKPNSYSELIGSRMNWGCPEALLATQSPNCSTSQTGSVEKIPIIAIDAKTKTIDLQGEHGQGILYIYGGNLKITGKFQFYGIIIIDGGRFEIAGTGAEGTKIEGSLLATGGLKDSRISGDAVVNYNSCAVTNSETAFNQNAGQNAAQNLNGGTFGWFEIVR